MLAGLLRSWWFLTHMQEAPPHTCAHLWHHSDSEVPVLQLCARVLPDCNKSASIRSTVETAYLVSAASA
jgi:hypothetical protein